MKTPSPLEDTAADILGKALRGLGLDPATAARRAGLDPGRVRHLLEGGFEEAEARALARALGLDPEALVAIGLDRYHPELELPSAMGCVVSVYSSMTVNAYAAWDLEAGEAVIFDTGTDAEALLNLLARHGLSLRSIFLTHSHSDHIHALAALKRATEAEAWSSEFEPVRGTRTFRPGDVFNIGPHFIRTRHTAGHTPGGVTYILEGRHLQAAVVGDALFAGSIGGPGHNYQEALAGIRSEILSLPPETILCPGHGPLTTVGLESRNNPFFATAD